MQESLCSSTTSSSSNNNNDNNSSSSSSSSRIKGRMLDILHIGAENWHVLKITFKIIPDLNSNILVLFQK